MLGDAVRDLAGVLTVAGINATGDARDLQVPGAWVEPAGIEFETLAAGSATVRVRVLLIVPDNGPMASMDALSDMLLTVRRLGLQMENITPTGATLINHGADPLPAIQFDAYVGVTDL